MRPEQCRSGEREYETGRSLMEEEVNAAISGALSGGASRIVVADSHATMCNLRTDQLPSGKHGRRNCYTQYFVTDF
jgi:D-amino peptidase